ncbi:MAG: PHP domain-containing protein [Vulcanisaeta sp.]|jgi:hypothetical protein|nr:PHP domain-containing protein [Vulcanisaeta sp.]MCG2869314.1 PHP domain-containing protein [Vulcanisaeta sp.]MCG2886388.1 PHP domain-containing protein [Vulcanisaeta sp.]MCG2892815.1 PHP domain-containing protein [Vulcanisaeta sp.]
MPIQVKADLHTHSIYSDGKGSPEDVIINAVNKNLKVLSITDHNTFKGSLKALELINGRKALSNDLLLIVGNEVRTDDGDVLVLCMEYPGTDDLPKSIPELLDWADLNNCLAIPAHPYDIFRRGIGGKVRRYRWRAVETFNAGSLPISNWIATKTARELGIIGIANSDAHIPELVGVAYTLFELDELSVEGVFKALINGNVKPVGHYPSPKLLIKRLSWSIKRRLGRP